ncbi:FKBP-type peptidyl-prolyl cis-trans isomerase [Klenkia sp. PcliD-1-E]|uniref:FKBP-type peptidyl-prolyl cis-trans isomerase n=1 Tax=Klenkia sp. PcliD-1-E TaxID=2954492 RepID=UPI002096E3C6|nr:FKBP-type peptidyl-prolyl cis-trans isomerase [Klenkia sp. PcliD-1-E]MCO7221475.1 FKBP-type peptidyl-prolyl cis-trans isomerase [Klenkia sp. PcliD-1-E]
MIRRRTALLVLPAALLLAACGSSSDGGTASSSGGATTSSPAVQGPTTGAAACTSAPATAEAPSSVSADLSVQPEVTGTDAPPPCGLVVADVVVGDGPVAESGSAVEVKYVGAFYDTGQTFDASWNRGADSTLPFTAGAGRVIQGFDQGVQGMAVGGRRVITIPSDLGYGPAGQGPIPGGATLVFVVDLVSVS